MSRFLTPVQIYRFAIPPLMCARKRRCPDGAMRKAKDLPPVPKLVGYYTNGKSPNFDRAREYSDWKKHVAENAPFMPAATKDAPVRVDVWCYFPSGTHSDPENVRKGIVDALFPAGDKFVYGYHHHPLYDAANPRVEVEVTTL